MKGLMFMKNYRVGFEIYDENYLSERVAIVNIKVPDEVSKEEVFEALNEYNKGFRWRDDVEKILEKVIEKKENWSYQFESLYCDIVIY